MLPAPTIHHPATASRWQGVVCRDGVWGHPKSSSRSDESPLSIYKTSSKKGCVACIMLLGVVEEFKPNWTLEKIESKKIMVVYSGEFSRRSNTPHDKNEVLTISLFEQDDVANPSGEAHSYSFELFCLCKGTKAVYKVNHNFSGFQ
jgi:hypothetical protein